MSERFNTRNPRPSNSMKDLNDNALAYDDFLNSDADNAIDRFERPFPTVRRQVSDRIDELVGASQNAEQSAERAESAAEMAISVVDTEFTFTITPTDPDGTIAGLAATKSGQSFRVAQGMDSDTAFIYYLNDNGSAVGVSAVTGEAAIASLRSLIKEGGGGSKYFMRWKDRFNTVVAGWMHDNDTGRVSLITKLLQLSSNGLKTDVVEYGNDTIKNSKLKISPATGGGWNLVDSRGVVGARLKNGILQFLGFKMKMTSDKAGGEFLMPGLSIRMVSGKDGIKFIDKRGIVSFWAKPDGTVKANLDVKLATQSTEKVILGKMQADAIRYTAIRAMSVRHNVIKPIAKLVFWFVYGQSFSVGAQSSLALSTVQTLGNVMLGQSPRGMYFSNTAESNGFGPVGGDNVFCPLVEVIQDGTGAIITTPGGGYGETISWSFAETLKRRHNERKGVVNDDNLIIGVACCGVSGRSIAQLQKGANPELYQRYLSALDGIAEAAHNAGMDWEVGGIIYMQGENDAGATYSYYLPQLQTMYDNMISDAMIKTGQNAKPIFLINQIGANYISDSASLGVPKAQVSFCEQQDGAFMVGSYQNLPDPGAHLFANSYRWMGEHFAKVADRILNNEGQISFRMINAVWTGNHCYVSFSVPVPPLRFGVTYEGKTPKELVDKGFAVQDTFNLYVGEDLAVEIVSDTVIKLSTPRPLVGNVSVSLGSKANHKGLHNVCDSDKELGVSKWIYGLPGQPSGENIVDLVNKNYSLANFCTIGNIVATHEE